MNNLFLGLFTFVVVLFACFTISYLAGIHFPNASASISFLGGMVCGSLGVLFYARNSS